MPFQQFGFPATLVKNVHALGYQAPTEIQAQAIPAVQSGRDIIATAQTGTGKTAAFLLPVLQPLFEQPRGGTRALILTPTRELAQQIFSVARGLTVGSPVRSVLIVGGAAQDPQIHGLRAGVALAIATPGRLLALLREGHANLNLLRTLVLDEADQMFDLGFFPDLKRIISMLPKERQTMLFSATMPPDVAQLGKAILRDPVSVGVGPQGTASQSVNQSVYMVHTPRKTALLKHLLEKTKMPSVLVFTRTKHGARKLAKALSATGRRVAELHSDRTPAQRTRAMHGFRAGAFQVMVATNIAARGLDVRHITHVVNFDVPHVPEEYVHRIGRTGRGGDEGDSLVLVAPEERTYLNRIERQLGKPIPRRRLEDFDYGANATPILPEAPINEDAEPAPQIERPFFGRRRFPPAGGPRPNGRKPYSGAQGRRKPNGGARRRPAIAGARSRAPRGETGTNL